MWLESESPAGDANSSSPHPPTPSPVGDRREGFSHAQLPSPHSEERRAGDEGQSMEAACPAVRLQRLTYGEAAATIGRPVRVSVEYIGVEHVGCHYQESGWIRSGQRCTGRVGTESAVSRSLSPPPVHGAPP